MQLFHPCSWMGCCRIVKCQSHSATVTAESSLCHRVSQNRGTHASQHKCSCLQQLILCGHVQVGPHICLFKTHVDIFDHWDASVADKLCQLADKHSMSLHHLCDTFHYALPIMASPAPAVHDVCCNAIPQALCGAADQCALLVTLPVMSSLHRKGNPSYTPSCTPQAPLRHPSSTPTALLMHPSSTPQAPLKHSNCTPHAPLMHPHPPLKHPSCTPHAPLKHPSCNPQAPLKHPSCNPQTPLTHPHHVANLRSDPWRCRLPDI